LGDTQLASCPIVFIDELDDGMLVKVEGRCLRGTIRVSRRSGTIVKVHLMPFEIYMNSRRVILGIRGIILSPHALWTVSIDESAFFEIHDTPSASSKDVFSPPQYRAIQRWALNLSWPTLSIVESNTLMDDMTPLDNAAQDPPVRLRRTPCYASYSM